MTYNPRTGIPTEQVGSLPRPTVPQDAYAAYDDGKRSSPTGTAGSFPA